MDTTYPDAQIEISGELVKDAEVRTVLMGDDQTPMPVLCLLIKADRYGYHPVRSEVVYPAALRHEADKAARGLKRGTRVTATSPVAHLRMTMAMTSNIQVHGRAKQAKATPPKEATHA